MPLTALIVDDEPLARDGLRLLLARDPDLTEVREAAGGREAVASLRDFRPHLLFLDVQMPEMDGFAVVREVGAEALPVVVFVTAHDRYALQAFEISAADYLLKPVTAERFATALARAKARVRAEPPGEAARQILGLLEAIAAPQRSLKRVAVRSAGRTVFVDLAEVGWMQAAENYVELHAGRAVHLLHVPMARLEAALDPAAFLRIHRSLIVNTRRIRELLPDAHGDSVVVLDDGTRLRCGRRYADRLRALASNPF
jgi:two-component system LytT family response regulator